MIRGFKGSINKEMISPDERHSIKGATRYYLGMGIWIALLIAAGSIMAKQTQPRTFEVKTNEKGEIIELKEDK